MKFDILRLQLDSKTYEFDYQVEEMPIGQSRIGGPVVDLPESIAYPEEMYFAAMLDLGWLSKFDKDQLLPANGFLYVFYNCTPETDEISRVEYFDGAAESFTRVVNHHDRWFYLGRVVKSCELQSESLSEWYDEEGDWNYFAGTEKTKLFGIHADCQRGESEILNQLKSNEMLLLQIGSDATGSGTLGVFIPRDDLKKRKFSKCRARWAQS